MVLPRFLKLPTEQQQTILRAALDEFSAHGFHDASLNRIIEVAGISKGSLYYYFDGKDDLYAHLTRTEVERLFADIPPPPLADQRDPETFWTMLADYYLKVVSALAGAPRAAALVRGWTAASRNPTLQRAQGELEEAALPWIQDALAAGQRIGAVRSDLPATLLIAVIVGMGGAMDLWLMSQPSGTAELPQHTSALVAMMRGALQPPAAEEDASGRS